MTYIMSITLADDDVAVSVSGVELKAHDKFAFAGPKGPWRFDAQVGDPIHVAAYDNWGGCRSIGAITLTHEETGESQVLFDGSNLGCGFPHLDPYREPAVQFFSDTFTVAVPASRPPRPGEDEDGEMDIDCLLAALGLTNVRGAARLAMRMDLIGDPVGAFPEQVLSYTQFHSEQAPASMGFGWSLSLHQRAKEENQILRYFDGSGSSLRWDVVGSSYVPTRADNHVEATRNELGNIRLTFPDQTRLDFDRHGRIGSKVDRNGNTLTWTYEDPEDGRSYLSRVSDGHGRILLFEHRNDGQPSALIDSRGPRITYEYFPPGDPRQHRLRAAINQVGDRTEFDYDAALRVSEVKTPGGRVALRLTYYPDGENAGKVATESYDLDPATGVEERRISYTYRPAARENEIVVEDLSPAGDPTPRRYLVRYDERFNIVYTRDPLGNESEFYYNAQGNLRLSRVFESAQAYHDTILRYYDDADVGTGGNANLRNLPYEVRRPAVTVLDESGQPVTQVHSTVFHYDSRGNLERVIGPGSFEARLHAREQDGLVDWIEDANRQRTLFQHDGLGRLLTVTTPATPDTPTAKGSPALTTSLRYHPTHFDRLAEVEEPGSPGRVWAYEFDDAGRLRKVMDPRGQQLLQRPDQPQIYTTEFVYREGLLDHVIAPPNHGSDGQFRVTAYEYDHASRLERILADVDSALPQERQLRARFEFDGLGNLRALVRQMNRNQEKATRYGYDLLSRPTSSTDPLGRTATTDHEPFCRSFAHTSARGKRTSVHFDSLCRLDGIANEEGDTEFTHDEWGRVVEVLQPTGTKASARYGSARYGVNRYGDESQVKERRTYEYDERSLLVATTFPDGRRLRYERDAAGQVSALVGTNQDVEEHRTDYTYLNDGRLWTVTHGGQTYRYEYGADGRLQFLHYPAQTKILAEYVWDAGGNLQTLHYRREGISLHKMEYLYDPSGNRTHFIDTPMDLRQKVTHEYRYDRLNRLRKVYHDGVLVSAYGFDHSDNRSEMTKLVDNAMRSFTYEYDAADQLLGVKRDGVAALVFQHDADGNMTEKKDLLAGRTDSYAWNSSGRLTAITLEERLQPSRTSRHEYDAGHIRKRRIGHDGARTNYYYSGLAPLLQASDRPGVGASTLTYIAGHQLLGLVEDGQFRHFVVDALGSVRVLLDHEGFSLANYTYDEYGHIPTGTHQTSTERTFIGSEGVQAEGALYLMSLRWYEPSTGVFLSRDPLDVVGGLNLYSYAHRNPVNLVDPTGLMSLDSVTSYVKAAIARGAGSIDELLEVLKPAVAAAGTRGGAAAAVWTQALLRIQDLLRNANKTGDCDKLARNIYDILKDARIPGVQIQFLELRSRWSYIMVEGYKNSITETGKHVAIVINNRAYDAFTGVAGMPIPAYQRMFQTLRTPAQDFTWTYLNQLPPNW